MKIYQRLLPYVIAFSCTAIALLVTIGLEPFLLRTIGAFFYIAIMVTAWYGGFQPGFVALVLSGLCIDYVFISEQYHLGSQKPEDIIPLILFLGVGLTINFLMSNFRADKQKIERLQQQLAQENAELQKLASQVGLSLQQSALWEQVQNELAKRQQAEARLQEKDAILRFFAQYAPAGIAMFDREMRYLMASQRWVDQYNLGSVEALIHRSHYEIFPEIPERWRQIHQRCLAGASEKCDQDLFIRADGTKQWESWEIHPWYTAAHEIGGIIVCTVNITQRHLAELALRESEKKLRLFIQYVPINIVMFDREMRYMAASQRWVDEFNFPSLEWLMGRSHYEVFPELDERLKQAHQKGLAGFVETSEEDRFMHTDGIERWFRWEVHPWYEDNGEIGGIILFAENITERKHAQLALQESQIQLQRQLTEIETIYQSAPIGLNVLDTELRFVRINQRLAEMNGFPVEAHIGRTVRELLPELADIAEPPLRFVIETGEPILNVEIVGETPAQHGVKRIWLESFLPLKDGDQVIGINTVCEEITERKQAEIALQQLNAQLEQRVEERTAELNTVNAHLREALTALEQSEERRRLALDLTHTGFWDLHLPSRKLIWNDNHFRLLGLDPYSLETSYEMWRNCIHPDDRDWVEQQFLESLENRRDYVIEYRVVHPDNSIHWVMGRGKAISDESGKPVRSVGVLLDISDRKQTEEALKESEAQFRCLSESSPIGIFMANSQGQCTYTNPRYQAICGCQFDELLGEGYLQFIHPEDREEILAQWSTAIFQQQGFEGKFRYVDKAGKIRFVKAQSAAILSVSGEIIGYVGTVEDITNSRTIETMKREFISIVSHELRTPLTAIRGAMGLLAAGVYKNKPEAAQKMLDIALHDTERLVRLVNDILDLERLEAQKVTLNKRWCNAETLLRQSGDSLQGLAEQSHVTLSVVASAVQVWGDSDRIIQTLVNLVSNAIKFSPPETTVTLSVQDQADRVLFQIQDQGRGIPDDKLETIFGRFQQLDASDSRQKGGTGLGLAICKSIVQQHGGTIWVESVVGAGSCFYFTLPKPLD